MMDPAAVEQLADDLERQRDAEAEAERQSGALRREQEHTDIVLDVPVTLTDLLTRWGPPYGFTLSDEDVFDRLDRFGLHVWRLPSPAARARAREGWVDFLCTGLVPGLNGRGALRVVADAITDGRRLYESLRADPTTAASTGRYLTIAELAALPVPDGLVHGLMDRGALATTYGPSGVGKTFHGLNLSLCVATGTACLGHAVTPGPVLYVAGEGVGHLAYRIDAWQREHGYTGDPIANFRVLTRPVSLLEPGDVEAFLTSLRTWDPAPVLITYDTLALCLAGGDENSTADMSRAVEVLRTIRDATSATQHVMHHTGWTEQTRERGSVALRGAMDLTMSLKAEAGELVLACEKSRDTLPFAPLRFTLAPSGRSVVPRAVLGSKADHLSPATSTALDTLVAITTRPGEWVEFSRWKAASICADGRSAQLRQMGVRTFYDCVRVLNECGLIDDEGEGRKRKVRHRVTENLER